MKNKDHNKLLKASTQAAESGVEHLLLIKHPDGTVKFNGTANIMQAISGNQELFDQVKTLVLSTQGPPVPIVVLSYPLLPCSPLSAKWYKKGSTKKIRGVLQTMITNAGFGKYGKKLGAEEYPLGWPGDVPWDTFKGVGNSGLTNESMTKIICGMLRAANLDPAIHIEPEQLEPYEQEEQAEVALVEQIEGVYDVPAGIEQEPGDEQAGEGEQQLQEPQMPVLHLLGTDGPHQPPAEALQPLFEDLQPLVDGGLVHEGVQMTEFDPERVATDIMINIDGLDQVIIENIHIKNEKWIISRILLICQGPIGSTI